MTKEDTLYILKTGFSRDECLLENIHFVLRESVIEERRVVREEVLNLNEIIQRAVSMPGHDLDDDITRLTQQWCEKKSTAEEMLRDIQQWAKDLTFEDLSDVSWEDCDYEDSEWVENSERYDVELCYYSHEDRDQILDPSQQWNAALMRVLVDSEFIPTVAAFEYDLLTPQQRDEFCCEHSIGEYAC